MKRNHFFFILVYLHFSILGISQSYKHPLKISNDTLYYEVYHMQTLEKIYVGDLHLVEGVLQKQDFGNIFFNDKNMINFKLELLELGYGRLKDSLRASSEEILAQKKAIDKKKGVWSTPSKEKISTIKAIWAFLKEHYQFIIGTLISLGIFTWARKKFWLERQLRLLIIGEKAAGKTAMFRSLVNSNTTREDILSLSPSKASESKKSAKIPHGKYEIILDLQDVPGSEYGKIWDFIIKRKNYAIVFMLAPFMDNSAKNINGKYEVNKISVNEINKDFINVQYGLLKAFVGGLASKGVKKWRKPKIMILFINKFDAFSNINPNDSSAKETAASLRLIFKDHIRFVEESAKKGGFIPRIVIGSTAEKYGIEDTLNSIKSVLY